MMNNSDVKSRLLFSLSIALLLITQQGIGTPAATGAVRQRPVERTLRSIGADVPPAPLLPAGRHELLGTPGRDEPVELAYDDEEQITYFLTMPNDWDDQDFFVRFTPDEEQMQLVGMRFVLFDVFGNQGRPGMNVSIRDNDNSFPGDELLEFDIDNGGLVFSSNDNWQWNDIDLTGFDLHFQADEFFLVINVNQGDEEDTLALVTDDGRRRPSNRSGLRSGDDFEYHNLVDIYRERINFSLRAIVEYEEEPQQREVILRAGWNTISLNILPMGIGWVEDLGPDPIEMLEQFHSNDLHYVVLMKDSRGRFFSPADEVCQIPYWNLAEAYQINMREPLPAYWAGTPIEFDQPIPLTEGWNLVPYYPEYELEVIEPTFAALSSIRNHLLVAKNDVGDFIVPEHFYSQMPPLRPGEGYHVKVDADCELIYPEEPQGVRSVYQSKQLPEHFSLPLVTGSDMSLLINSFEGLSVFDGDEVAAFDERGLIVGAGVISKGRCGLALRGDDPNTAVKEGLIQNEPVSLKIWQSQSDLESTLFPVTDSGTREIAFGKDDLAVVDASATSSLPAMFYLDEPWPNPFNSSTRLTFGLPEAGDIGIAILDLDGRVVRQLIHGYHSAGEHEIVLEGNSLSSGMYFLRLNYGQASLLKRIVLIR